VRFDKWLFDDVLSAPFAHAQLLVVLAIVRWTYGHRDRIEGASMSLTFIATHTGLAKVTVRRALAELTEAGVVIVVRPPSGRRAAYLALNPHSACWGRFTPGNERPKRAGRPEAFASPVECAPVTTLRGEGADAVECAPESTHGARQRALYGPQSARQRALYRLPEEQYEDCSSESSGGRFADAPPPEQTEQEPTPEQLADIKARSQRYLDDRRQREQQAVISRALGKEPAS
jgi:DNA-binding transcriptional ArsR family regulator